MATSLAEILADLRHEARAPQDPSPAVAADARSALGRLRPAFERLRDEGVDTGISIDADPDAFGRQADRVHWVMVLATTCGTLGDSVPAPEVPGRLTNLADAAAVAATVHSDTATSGERWAVTAALARAARHLTTVAVTVESTPASDRALIVAEASSSVLFQFAALDPPTAAELAALHRPVPNPAADRRSVDDAALDASAALVHATRPGTAPHSIADMLAIATAASTVCRSVSTTGPGAWDSDGVGRGAARSWTDFRAELTPFNDGSRRPQTGHPPAVAHARTLHDIFDSAALRSTTPSGVAQHTVLDRLVTVARNLAAAVDTGISNGQFMAYAADLPYRDSRIDQYLRGRNAAGLITADAADLAPACAALRRAETATGVCARGISRLSELSIIDRSEGVREAPLRRSPETGNSRR